jgi:hypothetical protein
MTTDNSHFGSGKFMRDAACTGPQMRIMEAANIIKPTKSENGWRQFTKEDVTAARAWLRANVRVRVKMRRA